MNFRRAIVLSIGLSFLGASCSYGPKAWQQTGNTGTSGSVQEVAPSVAPTAEPTQTVDQIDEDTTKLGADIDTQMKQNDTDLQGASKDSQGY